MRAHRSRVLRTRAVVVTGVADAIVIGVVIGTATVEIRGKVIRRS
jgi:hypothetical protein